MKQTHILGTTPEQVEKLLAAGLNPNTADLHYSNLSNISSIIVDDEATLRLQPYNEAKDRIENFTEISVFMYIAPAWSVGSLWQILHDNGIHYSPNTLAMDSDRLLTLLVNWIVNAIKNNRINQEFLASPEASIE